MNCTVLMMIAYFRCIWAELFTVSLISFPSVFHLPLHQYLPDQFLGCANFFHVCHVDVFRLQWATAHSTLFILAFFANTSPRLFLSVFHCIWWCTLTPSTALIIMVWLPVPRPLIQILNQIGSQSCPWKTLAHLFPTWNLFSFFLFN